MHPQMWSDRVVGLRRSLAVGHRHFDLAQQGWDTSCRTSKLKLLTLFATLMCACGDEYPWSSRELPPESEVFDTPTNDLLDRAVVSRYHEIAHNAPGDPAGISAVGLMPHRGLGDLRLIGQDPSNGRAFGRVSGSAPNWLHALFSPSR
jgi:hypothetical protein